MTNHRFAVILGLVALAQLGGCAHRLPAYPPMSDAESLAAIAERQAAVETISAECDLDLTDARGQRVALDGVLVAELPGKVRLRAWKFGQAVFDLTPADGSGWVMVPEDGPGAGRFDVQTLPSRQVREAMNLLGPSYFQTAKGTGSDSATLRSRGTAFGRDDVACEIERRTLTPRRFVVAGDDGTTRSELVLDQYALVGGIAWPMRMRLHSASGEVLVRFREIDLNVEVAAGAFTPPRRAKALP